MDQLVATLRSFVDARPGGIAFKELTESVLPLYDAALEEFGDVATVANRHEWLSGFESVAGGSSQVVTADALKTASDQLEQLLLQKRKKKDKQRTARKKKKKEKQAKKDALLATAAATNAAAAAITTIPPGTPATSTSSARAVSGAGALPPPSPAQLWAQAAATSPIPGVEAGENLEPAISASLVAAVATMPLNGIMANLGRVNPADYDAGGTDTGTDDGDGYDSSGSAAAAGAAAAVAGGGVGGGDPYTTHFRTRHEVTAIFEMVLTQLYSNQPKIHEQLAQEQANVAARTRSRDVANESVFSLEEELRIERRACAVLSSQVTELERDMAGSEKMQAKLRDLLKFCGEFDPAVDDGGGSNSNSNSNSDSSNPRSRSNSSAGKGKGKSKGKGKGHDNGSSSSSNDLSPADVATSKTLTWCLGNRGAKECGLTLTDDGYADWADVSKLNFGDLKTSFEGVSMETLENIVQSSSTFEMVADPKTGAAMIRSRKLRRQLQDEIIKQRGFQGHKTSKTTTATEADERGGGGGDMKQSDPRSEYVYIYWDIENISIPGVLNPKKGEPQVTYRVVCAIRDYLDKKGILAKTTTPDRLMSRETFRMYYRPMIKGKANTTLTETALRDMDRAGIQLVATASNKQEACDRVIESDILKLCNSLTEAHADAMAAREKLRMVCRTLRELCGMDPNMLTDGNGTSQKRTQAERSTIVLISSDFDFKKVLKTARELGFRIVVIHDSGLTGDCLLGYKRECQAKMIEWEHILQKLVDATNKRKAAQKKEEGKLIEVYNTPLTEPETLLLLRVLRKVGAGPNLYKDELGDACQKEVLALLSKSDGFSRAGLEDAFDGVASIIAATHLPRKPLEEYGAPDVGIRASIAAAVNGAEAGGSGASVSAILDVGAGAGSRIAIGSGDGGGGSGGSGGSGSGGGSVVGQLDAVDNEADESYANIGCTVLCIPDESLVFGERKVTRTELLNIVGANNPFQLYVRRAEKNGIISFDRKRVKVKSGVINTTAEITTATATTNTSPRSALTVPGSGPGFGAVVAVSPRLANGAEVSGISGMLDFSGLSATSSIALDDSMDRPGLTANQYGQRPSPAPAVLDLQSPGLYGIDDFPGAFGEVTSSEAILSPVLPSSAQDSRLPEPKHSNNTTNRSNNSNAYEDIEFSFQTSSALTPEPEGSPRDGTNGANATNGAATANVVPQGNAGSFRQSTLFSLRTGSYEAAMECDGKHSPDSSPPHSGRMPSVVVGGGGGGALAVSTPTVPASPISIAPGWTPTKATGGSRAGNSSVKRHKLVQWDGAVVTVAKYKVVKPFMAQNYVLFILTVREPFGDIWQVERRYSDFEKLHVKLTDLKFTKPLEPMPGKSLTKLSEDVSRERMIQFQKILEQCQELTDAHNETEALKMFLSQ